jgi:hypothetical protein
MRNATKLFLARVAGVNGVGMTGLRVRLGEVGSLAGRWQVLTRSRAMAVTRHRHREVWCGEGYLSVLMEELTYTGQDEGECHGR